LALAATVSGFTNARSDEPRLTLLDAQQQGTFNVGTAHADLHRVPDSAAFRLAYTLPPGTLAGLWTKAFPDRFRAGDVDRLQATVTVPGTRSPGPVEVMLELKGSAGTQRVPLGLQSGASTEQALDWAAIGTLSEVVVVLRPLANAEPLAGSLDIEIGFSREPWIAKYSKSVVIRMAAVASVAALLAALLAVLRAVLPGKRRFAANGLAGDFVSGAAVVASAALAIAVYLAGQGGTSMATVLALALAGGAIGAWLTVGLTGRWPTPGQVLLDTWASGCFAASASSLTILQAPVAWAQMLMLSSTTAAAAICVYHAANALRLVSTRRHLGLAAGAAIVAVPYVVGSLVVLESGRLMETLGGLLSGNGLASQPELSGTLGRMAVVLGFNEIVANLIGLVGRRRLVRSPQTHLWLLVAAAMVVAGPWIAAWGSGAQVASWSPGVRIFAVVLATAASQAGLWAEVYLITGLVLDALDGRTAKPRAAERHSLAGIRKGVVYSGVFMAILYGLDLVARLGLVRWLAANQPLLLGAVCGGLAFPLVKTLIETFDGSHAFFRRLGYSYRQPTLYARGVLVGLAVAYALAAGLPASSMADRAWFGFVAGLMAYAGVSLARDGIYAARRQGLVQSWRVYLVEAALGGLVGAAIGFYLDAAQVAVVTAKFHRYLAINSTPEPYGVYPLLSKWGFLNLGQVTGGSSLLLAEALAGVISWSIPAWLFAINRTFLSAWFQRESGPIRGLATKAGMVALVGNMIEVLRWGLWMSPIINSFLRPMGDPTWYNQDGAVRTLLAVVRDSTLTPDAFRAWSLQMFIYLLAFDGVRILIWLDHMGLRVATLVNLSFLGMDRLDERLARFLGPAATASCIPEAVKRFATWAPLLIPFYIPRGADWDTAWGQAEALSRAAGPGPLATLAALPPSRQTLIAVGAVIVCTALCSVLRWARGRRPADCIGTLRNTAYEVTLHPSGAVVSRVPDRGYDVTRRSYDLLDPAGRALFLVDEARRPDDPARVWPVVGNVPCDAGPRPELHRTDDGLQIEAAGDGLRCQVEISLPAVDDPVELWTIRVDNLAAEARTLRVVPYLEWVLNRPDADRGHTQYNRLFAEMEYAPALHAILAWDKHSKALGLLAADVAPAGFLTSRVDFLGRAGRLRRPEALETLAFTAPCPTDGHPTFDPIGSLLLGIPLEPGQSATVRLLMGLVKNKQQAIEVIARHLQLAEAAGTDPTWKRKPRHAIGHGRIPPGTPQPYSEFRDRGRKLVVHTPFTPRPFDHTLANRLGHVTVVTNRGLHTTSSGNSQQNRLTPDWPDTVTRELPGEAIYLYDLDRRQWYSPTYQPLHDASAVHTVEFGVDGTAVYHMRRGDLSTELTVFVPPDEPAGVYLLRVRNHADCARRIRVAPYFQIVLANQPEHSGPLKMRRVETLNALVFENPRNRYREGPAFVAMSTGAERIETARGRFFGAAGDPSRPYFVEHGEPDLEATGDERPVAALVTTLEIPAHGEQAVAFVLGQADDWRQAEAAICKFQDPEAAQASLEQTRAWWLRLMSTLDVETAEPAVNGYLDWLKYQALAERIWARRGFYQASGAFGFRDQLQDAVNLMWVDPRLARQQILLCASQQFLEGDVVHWFHRLSDGRTGFAARTHASDNLLWLPWAVAEYVQATGDDSLLGESAPYLVSDQPFAPLPEGKHGMGFVPLRASRRDSVYRHALRAIDLVLQRRLGVHGLPLIGTGDWNDGLDEIGSQGRGESVWLGMFLYGILQRMTPIIERAEGPARATHYQRHAEALRAAIQQTWRGDRYLRAIHDDGTEIGLSGSGVWEIDALTAAWAVISGIDPARARIVFDTALKILEQENTILLGWPALREDTQPYLGRSSGYPEGVRENGMYCHGVQWLVGAARLLAERCHGEGDLAAAEAYRRTAYRLWLKISPIPHTTPEEIETYGGQPNKQSADMVTSFAPGRMIWHGYTGAAGWMLRQALEGVLGARLAGGEVFLPADLIQRSGELTLVRLSRDVRRSPLGSRPAAKRPAESGSTLDPGVAWRRRTRKDQAYEGDLEPDDVCID
jgi:cyclic beta-1,2-glucan synthetase